MKSFGKTFRTFLAMSLALCMVMSCVTVSAASPITLTKTVSDTPDANGYYEAVYTVNGISAEGGNATILVYDADGGINNDTIEYANQVPVSGGTATFTMLLDNGNYAVLAGGTSVAEAATDTVTAGSAPTISANPIAGVKDNETNAVVANITVVDADATETDDNIDSIEITAGNTGEYFAVSDKTIVTTKDVPANTYNLTLTVTDDEGKTGTCTVVITIDKSVITVPALAITNIPKTQDWNEEAPSAPVAADYIVIEGAEATLSAWSEGVVDGAVTTYTATLTLPEGYQFEGGATTAEVTYTVTEKDSRPVIEVPKFDDISVEYGEAEPTINKTAENVTIGTWTIKEGQVFNSKVAAGTKYEYTATATANAGFKFADGETATVTVNVVVNDSRTEVTASKYADINIGYGDGVAEELKKLEAGTGLTFAGEWTCANGFDDKVEGTYVFTNTVKVTDDIAYKLVGSDAVSVNVIVTDDRQVVTGITIVNEDIEVAYNTTADKIDFTTVKATYTVDKDEAPSVVIGEFTCDTAYNPTVPGEYTFTAVIENKDNDVYKINADVAKEITVKVIVGSNVYVMTEGAKTLDDENAVYRVSGFDEAMDAVYVTGGTLTITDGTYDGGTTPYDAPGNTAVFAEGADAKVIINGGYFTVAGLPQKDEKYDDGHIDLIYAKAGATIEISGGTFDARGDYVWGVNVNDKEPGTIVITGGTFIGWNPANPGFIGIDKNGNESVGKVETYLADGYTVKPVTVAGYENYDAWEVIAKDYVIDKYEFIDEDGAVVESFDVTVDTPWDVAVESFFPKTIKLYSGTLVEEVEFDSEAWINHKGEGFPPAEWTTEPFEVNKDLIKLPDYWRWADGATNPTINVRTLGDGENTDIVLKADGYEKKYVASRLGAASIITVDEITGAEAYAFTLNSAIAPEASDAAWGTTREYPIPADSDDIHGTRYAVTAHVKLLSGEIVSETIYVTKYTSVFSGSVYINDTVDELDYSAVRSNRNRDIVVSYKFSNANDTGYVFDGEAVVNVYSVNDLETPILTKAFGAGSNTITITSAEVKEFAVNDGEYKFYVTYTDDNEKIGDLTARKGTYISNNGTWYSDFKINNLTRSGIIVRKDETLTNEFTLAELGADGKAYIGYSLIGYNDTFADIAAGNYKETSSAYNKHEYDLTENFAEKANASYKFYSMVKLDSADQKYFDMNVSRVVYVYGSKTTISNLNMNGSNSAGPKVQDGKIVFKPNWYNEASKNLYDYDEIRYELTFTSGTSYDRLKDAVIDGEVVENTTTVKFADTGVGYDGTNSTVGTVTINANAFDSKVVAELKVYVDNKLDRTVNKIFWPIAE